MTRLLSKLAYADEVPDVSGAEQQSVHKVLEGASTGTTKQFAAEVEYRRPEGRGIDCLRQPEGRDGRERASQFRKKPTLGAVSYLNTQPLIVGITIPVIKKVPSELLAIFQSGEVDAVLLSIYDILSMQQAEVVDSIAIGCRGEVYSVLLAYEGELKNIKKIYLDPSSHTSNNLLKIILAEFHGLYPEFLDAKDGATSALPRVIIGDPAIAFQQQATCSILDLGAEWYHFTKLPFVFAMWCLNRNCTQKKYLIKMLQTAKKEGLLQREAIAATQSNPELALRYLTEHIRYDFGKEERQGLELFQSLLQKHHLISTKKNSINFLISL